MLSIPSTSELKSTASKAVGLRDGLDRQIEANAKEAKRLTNEEEMLTLVGALIRSLADSEVTDGIEAVTKLQTEGLQEIFPDKDLRLEAEVSESRGKVSVSLETVDKKSDGSIIRDNWEAFGGSVSTVESVLLRVIVMFRRGMRPLLLLDETLSAIARSYVDKMAGFLSTLCTRMQMDVLVVSHDPLLIDAADKAYEIVVHPDASVTFKEKR